MPIASATLEDDLVMNDDSETSPAGDKASPVSENFYSETTQAPASDFDLSLRPPVFS